MKENAEGTYKTKHAEAARLNYTTTHRHRDTNTKTKTEPHESLSTGTLVKVIEVPIVVSNTEGQGTRHSSVAARGVGGATDRDSLSTREANGATMLMEEDTAAVTKLLLVWLVIEVREIIGRLLVSDEVEQPQEFAVNAARGGHTRGQKRQRPMAVVRFPIRADFVSSGLIEELVRPVRVAERAMA